MRPKKGADGRWHAWLVVGTKPNGRPDQRHVSRATRDDCQDEVDRLLEQKRAATVPKAGKKPSLAEWLDTHFDTIPPSRCDPGTVRDYRSKMNLYVVPRHGNTKLHRLTATNLAEIYTAMERQHLAPSTIRKTHRILSRALAVAVKRRVLGRNPADDLEETPGGDNAKVKVMPTAAAHAVLDAADKTRNQSRWAVALSLGLRQGEALGLRWEFVDLTAGEIQVDWQLQRRDFEHGCAGSCGRRKAGYCPTRVLPLRRGEIQVEGGMILKAPKGKSARPVPIGAELVAALARQREVQDLERTMAGGAWLDHGFVWSREDGGPIDPKHDYQQWKALARAAGAPDARLHDARHFAASFLLALGIGEAVVQELLGHADARTTRGYQHAASDMLRAATSSSGATLLGRRGTP